MTRSVAANVVGFLLLWGATGYCEPSPQSPSTPSATSANSSTPESEADKLEWMLDANIGTPVYRGFDEVKLSGDLTFGILKRSFGVVLYGSGNAYNLDKNNTSGDLTRGLGNLDAWYVTAPSSVRFEARVALGASLYDSTYSGLQNNAAFLYDETSVLYRGSILIGPRVKLADRGNLSLLLGGGFQYEAYDYTNANLAATQAISLSTTDQSTYRVEARFNTRVAIVPNVVSVRLKSDFTYFSLLRSNEITSLYGSNPITTTTSTTTLAQIETSTRFLLYADAASFIGIAPALFAGVDTLHILGDVSTGSVMPIFGVGLLKDLR